MAITHYISFPTLCTSLLAVGLIVCWLGKINAIVPEPYLDEVFHVRQAAAYWQHRWRQWDPKITTPPGLYLVSYMIGAFIFLLFKRPVNFSAGVLRSMNGLVLFNALKVTLRGLLSRIWKMNTSHVSDGGATAKSGPKPTLWGLNLTVLNVCLFPPIFFFSGLYYTDIAALLVVLQAYSIDIVRDPSLEDKIPRQNHHWRKVHWRDLQFLIFGLAALLFRQTNIFWVAVFLGGRRVIQTTRLQCVDCNSSNTWKIARNSWELHQLYDPPVNEAYFEDYLKTILSLGISVLAHLQTILIALVPYLFILGAFGVFIIWNGSVVLGHKEFHTASLHLPQMLYIWPYFLFFSWPAIVLPWVSAFSAYLNSKTPTKPAILGTLPRLSLTACLLPIMVAIVHFNTIVHPFTLADNRHYVFYVFRLLLRHPIIKYAVVPIYFACGWAVITSFDQRLALSTSQPLNKDQPSKSATSSKPASLRDRQQNLTNPPPVRSSFVLIWLLSTALSLITAPLVEPRYFIIPWVIWRLHVAPLTPSKSRSSSGNEENASNFFKYLPIIVESVWYLLINAVTGYMFLYKGFEWPQEPGQVQRFMW